ncbi:hypothetical protein [Staphylococcus delphini]|uniref:Uncharacterized protein n=1 Tax=Staphylococcus delphini TaxID=53344 RepID=A0AAX0QT95_9STAP|nr:hypothetical protein [Staphylococcus delphini]PCF50062.1 hypothetical protein B5C07_07585 [Staphylococcus delphini]PNZ95684.1 hypothetical protein CD148_03125 [Staphylococcus delphini]RIZ56306.1 hypothetical protein CDL68_01840 [Staphylococcus delphini]VED62546.1 Uncharacterised protein [Staphylococcus delphini]
MTSKRRELDKVVKGIYMTYAHLLDEQEMDKMSAVILEYRVFKVIRELRKLPFSLSNLWYVIVTRRKLQKLVIEIQQYK